jgi:hypothetical protein
LLLVAPKATYKNKRGEGVLFGKTQMRSSNRQAGNINNKGGQRYLKKVGTTTNKEQQRMGNSNKGTTIGKE